MAWLKIESSVSRNKKFVKAGPAPSWLWLCGLSYCQEGLTDGFIPTEALPYLGVKNAAQLASRLVKAGLWDPCDEGWHVHDYLKHNKSASEIADVKAQLKENGKHGGRPKRKPEHNQSGYGAGNQMVSDTQTSPIAVYGAGSGSVAVVEEDMAMDVLARELVNLASAQARCGALTVERPLYGALHRIAASRGLSKREAWEWLKARLEQHNRSHKWRVKGMVNRLDRWLEDGVYEQELPEDPPAAERLSARTNVTLQGAADALRKTS